LSLETDYAKLCRQQGLWYAQCLPTSTMKETERDFQPNHLIPELLTTQPVNEIVPFGKAVSVEGGKMDHSSSSMREICAKESEKTVSSRVIVEKVA
jgi:hypothetical protein